MKTALVLHHTADRSTLDQYHKVKEYHNSGAPRGNGTLRWPSGHGIQYCKFIERDGIIMSGRKEHELTWHAGRINRISIGICLAGDFRLERPTNAQINSLVEIINELKHRHPIQHIYNHNEVRPTSCPVSDLVSLYEQEMILRGLSTKSAIAMRIRSLKRGMARATLPIRFLLQKQMDRLLKRIEAQDHI